MSNTNYIDTISAYYNYKEPASDLLKRHWKKDNHKDKSGNNIDSFHYRKGNVFLRHYPNLYGNSLLYITFSLPKIYYNSNNNCCNVIDFNPLILDSNLKCILDNIVDMTQLPPSFLDYQVSRTDLFYNHEVPVQHKDEYIKAYKSLYLSRYKKLEYKNTSYLMTNLKKGRSSSVVVRIYDKDLEMYERGIFTKDNTLFYPTGIHEDIERTIEIIDDYQVIYSNNGIEYGRIRFELQLRRRKLINTLNGKSVTVRDVFDPSFQRSMINKYFNSLGLDRIILSKDNFRKYVDSKGYKVDKRNNLINCAKLRRNERTPYYIETPSKNINVSRSTYNGYVNELKADGIHIITNRNSDLIPIKPL